MPDISTELERARLRLLDLSMRNRLLNHRPSKSKSIKVVDEVISEIYDRLVIKEQQMEFASKAVSSDEESEDEQSDDENESKLWKLTVSDNLRANHTDRFLQTNFKNTDLAKKLFSIYQQSKSIFEEQGYIALFLAMGFLEWYESDNSDVPHRAPLILIPVQLERLKVQQPFKLVWSGDDIYTNISLREALAPQGVSLPEFQMPEDKSEVEEYLSKVADSIERFTSWKVLNDIYLDFFSFKKFVMYKDLDPASWSKEKDPTTNQLLNTILMSEESGSCDNGFNEEDVDEKLDFKTAYHVMDADPSQIAVIEDVKAGKNVVVQGPPGTGKSQTITNIIAESLAQGKKVLFASEKMAALEVVKNRLRNAGLNDFCLELHSRKANKKELIKELQRTLLTVNPNRRAAEDILGNLDKIRAELNAYAAVLKQPFGQLKASPYDLMCRIERARRYFEKTNRCMPRIEFHDALQKTKDDYKGMHAQFISVAEAATLVSPFSEQAWIGCNPGIILPTDEALIEASLDVCLCAIYELRDELGQLCELAAIAPSPHLNMVSKTIDTLGFIATSESAKGLEFELSSWKADSGAGLEIANDLERYNGEKTILEQMFKHEAFKSRIDLILNGYIQFASKVSKYLAFWKEQKNQAYDLITKIEKYQADFEQLRRIFKADAFESDHSLKLADFSSLSKLRFKLLNGNYRTIKKQIRSLYLVRPPFKCNKIILQLSNLVNLFTLRSQIRSSDSTGKNLFGILWQSETSDVEQLKQYIKWIESFFNDVGQNIPKSIARDLSQAEINKTEAEQLCANIIELYQSEEKIKGAKAVIADLKRLYGFLSFGKQLDSLDSKARGFYGQLWRGKDSSPERIRKFATWISDVLMFLNENRITEKTVELIKSNLDFSHLKAAIKKCDNDSQQCSAECNRLFQKLKFDGKGRSEVLIIESDFGSTIDLLRLWKQSIHSLSKWGQYCLTRNNVTDSDSVQILVNLENDSISPKDVVPCFESSFAESALKSIFVSNPTLANFAGELHDMKIDKFVGLDRDLIALNRTRLISYLFTQRPQMLNQASSKSEAGILQGEFARKRGHMPIRKVLSKAGSLVQEIKPCFLMSPLSIAQFLNPEGLMFDVVVFDEASQVRPEDALGALLRVKQAVVVGDTKQLPPTNFFEQVVDDATEEDEENEDNYTTASVADVESILHQCSRCFPTKMLRWHYRSRHESLIAVSNYQFYDNRLFLYPSPFQKTKDLGLSLVHHKESSYDRGKSGTNRDEAKAVAMAALRHFQTNPDKSLGIGTFNIKQQEAILEEIEFILHSNPDMQSYFGEDRDEHFFVKNLETIQGDERDVIFVSLGYGFDQNRKLTLNFGPLNQDGGERRLNVLMTRAREQCVIFSNFTAADLNIDGSQSMGLRALKLFLQFAETRNLNISESTDGDFDSPFEESVYDFLRTQGYEVHRQIGCAGFRVDLGVVSQTEPGKYIIGLECDGAKYHSSRVARDRDRLRQQILEQLGWTIHRIWSTDWYRRRKDCERRLLEAIVKAKTCPKATSRQTPGDTNVPHMQMDLILENNLPDLGSLAETYTKFKTDNIRSNAEFTITQLSGIVSKIVQMESPIHYEQLSKRIREYYGFARLGHNMLQTIQASVRRAAKDNLILIKGKFLWRPDEHLNVRTRVDSDTLDINTICEEEIFEATKIILKFQHASQLSDLVSQVSRLLGFKATREHTYNRIMKVINKKIDEGHLKEMTNGMIDFSQQ